jgi:5-methylcytosine-specific restriction endonuclease McrA
LPTADTSIAKAPPKTADAFYLSAEWRVLVGRLLVVRFGDKAQARCQDPKCQYPSRTGIRLFGDHVVELQDGGAPLDPANVLFRCGSCHTRKTIEVRAQRMARRSAPVEGGGMSAKK